MVNSKVGYTPTRPSVDMWPEFNDKNLRNVSYFIGVGMNTTSALKLSMLLASACFGLLGVLDLSPGTSNVVVPNPKPQN